MSRPNLIEQWRSWYGLFLITADIRQRFLDGLGNGASELAGAKVQVPGAYQVYMAASQLHHQRFGNCEK
jgi:hypothetical protein